jgi:hypothetical protein
MGLALHCRMSLVQSENSEGNPKKEKITKDFLILLDPMVAQLCR